jgi:cytosine permease
MPSPATPNYLISATRVPKEKRKPWYINTAPSYAGIFLWIVFYETLGSALPLGGLAAALIGLALAAVICYGLYYLVFGYLGMQTGFSLYVVGSATFGARGGFLIPGIFMGVLQIGWSGVMIYTATRLLMQAFGQVPLTPLDPDPARRGLSLIFVVIAVVWAYSFAIIGALGIDYVSKVGLIFPIVPLLMLVIAAVSAAQGVGSYHPPELNPLGGALLLVQLTVGYFATAGAAGVDYGRNNRDKKDVQLGGLVGIALPIVLAGGLAVFTVAGAHGIEPGLSDFSYSGVLDIVNPRLASVMFLLFAISSMPPAGFSAYVMGNSLSTMIPSIPRLTWGLIGATIALALALSGLAGQLESFFGLIGASFGPVCGAMVAEYLLSGRKWSGPRVGINLPGYLAWIVGFLVGIANNPFLTAILGVELLPGWHPTAVYSFIVGFVVYALLVKLGMGQEILINAEEL